jgi:MarR family transcriptional regulator, transcriptional regulator for hemolysin
MPARDPSLDDDEAIHPEAALAPGYLANHATRVFNRNVDAVLREHGLSLALLGPLLLLCWKGPMRQRDLVAASAVKQPAMVALLEKLEASGLVVRSPSANDRRAATVALTDEGARLAVIGGDALRRENARGLARISTDEAVLLIDLLRRFITSLEEEHKHHS